MNSGNFPNITLRCATEADIPRLRELHSVLFPVQYNDQYFARIVDPGRTYTVLACDEGGSVVGFIAAKTVVLDCYGWYLFFPAKTAYITTFGVVPEFRRKGIGRQLIDHVIAFAAQNREFLPVDTTERALRAYDRAPVSLVTLHVQETNDGGRQFYAAVGFEEALRMEDYYSFTDEEMCTDPVKYNPNAYFLVYRLEGASICERITKWFKQLWSYLNSALRVLIPSF